jgi:hypothetical protein
LFVNLKFFDEGFVDYNDHRRWLVADPDDLFPDEILVIGIRFYIRRRYSHCRGSSAPVDGFSACCSLVGWSPLASSATEASKEFSYYREILSHDEKFTKVVDEIYEKRHKGFETGYKKLRLDN